MNKYLVSNVKDKESIAIDWTKIPEEFLSKISKDLSNIYSIDSEGRLVEKTVVYIKPTSRFPRKNVESVEFCGILLGKRLNVTSRKEK